MKSESTPLKLILPEKLGDYCQKLIAEFDLISDERKDLLQKLSDYISDKQKNNSQTQIIVICTHNSRRSHIGQLWLQLAAFWYGIEDFRTYSGGTEATAFNERSVEALRRAGFILEKKSENENPIYRLGGELAFMDFNDLFSKKYDSKPNPGRNLAAVMVCTEADEGCPFVPGTDARFSIPFEDPKAFDGTNLESQKYDERVRQMGREFFYMLSRVS